MSIILGLLFPLILVAGLVVLIKALTGNKNEDQRSDGGDLVAYGLLAIFVGGVVWALFLLGRAAFPGTDLVGTSRGDLAGALAGLIVAGPLAYYLWQRQDDRRNRYPDSVGWSLYLALTDAIYLSWLVVYLVLVVGALIGDGDFPRWTDVVIVAAVVLIHEWASRADQPGGNISQIHRVVGSFIGLVTLSTGVGLVIYSILDALFDTLTARAGDAPFEVGIAMTIVGAGVWFWRWLQPWTHAPDGTRLTYLVLVSYTSFVAMVAAGTSAAIVILTYFLEQPASAGDHFEPLPVMLAIIITAGAVWFHHHPLLGAARTDSVRSYEYLLMATGLGSAVGFGTTLVSVVFEGDLLVDDLGTIAVALILAFTAAGLLWWLPWSRAQEAPRDEEAVSLPRRFYLLGMAILLGLTAAGAVVGVLFFIFQLLFALGPDPSALVIELSLAALAGGATYHLYTQYRQDSGLREKSTAQPYALTVICSHPGPLAAALPPEARLRIIHRGDSMAPIDEETAARIVEQTLGSDSIVWVREGGFEIAPALKA